MGALNQEIRCLLFWESLRTTVHLLIFQPRQPKWFSRSAKTKLQMNIFKGFWMKYTWAKYEGGEKISLPFCPLGLKKFHCEWLNFHCSPCQLHTIFMETAIYYINEFVKRCTSNFLPIHVFRIVHCLKMHHCCFNETQAKTEILIVRCFVFQ